MDMSAEHEAAIIMKWKNKLQEAACLQGVFAGGSLAPYKMYSLPLLISNI